MIKGISDNIAGYLGQELKANHDQIEVYSYALQVILGSIVKAVLILSLAYLLGIFSTTMICLGTFMIFRRYGGGVHLSTYAGCLIFGTTMMLFLGKLASFEISLNFLLITTIIILALTIYSLVKWVPVGTEKRAITDPKQRANLKTKFILALIVWLFLLGYTINNSLINYALALDLGLLSSLILLNPYGYKSMKKFDQIINPS